jgi:hypothetical protein
MSEKLSRLEEKKIRGWIRQILAEDAQHKKTLLTEDWDDFWGPSVDGGAFAKTFISPFTDVLKVAQVAVKDLLSVATLNLELLFNFKSPEKAEMALNRYKGRKTKIQGEYKEVMKSTAEIMGGGDAKLLMFAMAPGAVLAAAIPGMVKDTAGFLADTGLVDPSRLPKTEKEKEAQGKKTGPIKGALDDLAKIFFMAHHEVSGPLLAEAGEEGKEEQSGGDRAEEVETFLEETGMDKELERLANDLFDAKKEQLEELLPVIQSQGAVIKSLAEAETLEDFKTAAAASGGAVESVGELEKMVKDEAQKMLKNPTTREEMVKKYAEKEGVKPEKDPDTGKEKYPEVEDEKLLPDMEVIVFAKSKEGLQEQLEEGQTTLKEESIAEVNDFKLSNADIEMLESEGTPKGKEMAALLRDAIKQINEA